MEKITFCIPSKNNLRYLKSCIPSIRKNANRKDHDIIVFVDKDTDGTVDWLKEVSNELNVKYIVNPDLNNSLYGIGRAYDKCISEATTDVVVVFHADMYLCKDADLKMYEKLTENTVVCATRIEPPLHPPGPEKIVKDFGLWPEHDVQDGFKESELDEYVKIITTENDGKTTRGCFAPWMVHKKNIVSIGGHDPVMKSAREDSDIFNRFILSGLDLVQVWDGFVYHLTCRGGQFEHGILTQDHSQKSKDWQVLMEQSTWDYIRKWGCFVEHDPYLMPIIKPKYDIGFVLTNSEYNGAKFLEPWCSTLYLDDPVLIDFLHQEIQPTTSYDVKERIKSDTEIKDHDIVVEIDQKILSNDNAKWIGLLSEIITEDQEPGRFELEGFVITVNRTRNLNKTLIPIQNEFFN
jgi:glycosyltransferase involved in cell wall biosynthesis